MLKTFVGLLSVFAISFFLMIPGAMAEEAATETETPAVDAAPPEGEEAQKPAEPTEESTETEEAAE